MFVDLKGNNYPDGYAPACAILRPPGDSSDPFCQRCVRTFSWQQITQKTAVGEPRCPVCGRGLIVKKEKSDEQTKEEAVSQVAEG